MNGVGEPVLAFDLDVAKVDKGSQLGKPFGQREHGPTGRACVD
jgi:hypothetical protein